MTEESRNVAGPRSPSSGYRPHQTTWLLLIYDVVAVSLAVCAPLILRLDTLDPNVSILPFLPAALIIANRARTMTEPIATALSRSSISRREV